MTPPALPLTPTDRKSARVNTNLYLPAKTKDTGAKVALDRYGISFSAMVTRLVDRECSTKKGLLGRS